MEITLDNFKEIVTERALHKAGVHAVPNAHKRAVQFYCNNLTVRSACTGECKTCALKIRDAVIAMSQQNNAVKQPYGLYTWFLKDASAKRVEELAKRPAFKPEANFLGEATERDAFDIFAETLNG
jgi:hypothetical protein